VEEAVRLAESGNDQLADAIRRHPTRYAGLATIPVQDPGRAVKEMERAITRLKLNGVMINSHTNGEYLAGVVHQGSWRGQHHVGRRLPVSGNR
jgi:predicted TIM-barrel fold metal-dependent hydrolase